MARHVAQSIYVAHITELLSGVSGSNGNIGLGTAVSHSGSWSQPVCRYIHLQSLSLYMTQRS